MVVQSPMTMISVLTAVTLFLCAALIALRTRANRRQSGLPVGELIYTDNSSEPCPLLVSYRYGLKGKPDALIRTPAGDVIPVERKKGHAPHSGPFDSDLIQAFAYCVLVEEHYSLDPPFVRIQYSDRWFDVPFTAEKKRWLLETCDRLREARHRADCVRSHHRVAKCRNCGQRTNCGQAL
jgi:hypothetical protein